MRCVLEWHGPVSSLKSELTDWQPVNGENGVTRRQPPFRERPGARHDRKLYLPGQLHVQDGDFRP
jgi:hypothetical protein